MKKESARFARQTKRSPSSPTIPQIPQIPLQRGIRRFGDAERSRRLRVFVLSGFNVLFRRCSGAALAGRSRRAAGDLRGEWRMLKAAIVGLGRWGQVLVDSAQGK